MLRIVILILLALCLAQVARPCPYPRLAEVSAEPATIVPIRKKSPSLRSPEQKKKFERVAQLVVQLRPHGYRDLQLIGGGGQADIFHATKEDGSKVILKVPRNELGVKFLRKEAEVLSEMNQMEALRRRRFFPKVDPKTKGIIELDDFTVLEMEHIAIIKNEEEAPNLKEVLINRTIVPKTESQVAQGKFQRLTDLLARPFRKGRTLQTDIDRTLDQLEEALIRLHSAGFVMRDLKPENILIDSQGNIKLIDMGLAAAKAGVHPGATGYTLPEHKELFGGTPRFSPEEQLRGSPAAETDDLHALRHVSHQMRALTAKTDNFSFYRSGPKTIAFGGSKIQDAKYAVEIPGASEAEHLKAMVEWSRVPRSIKKRRALRRQISKLDPKKRSYERKKAAFLKRYGRDLSSLDRKREAGRYVREEAAFEVLSAKVNIRYLDTAAGLKLTQQEIEEIALGAYALFEDAYFAKGTYDLFGPNPYLHFAPFFEKIRVLAEQGKVSQRVLESTTVNYLRLIRQNPDWLDPGPQNRAAENQPIGLTRMAE